MRLDWITYRCMAIAGVKSATVTWHENWFGADLWYVNCFALDYRFWLNDEFPFQELLGYSLPLINYHFVRRKFRSVVRIAMGSYNTTAQSERLKPKLTINSKCEYCNERPTLPHHMGCKHIFCYYCLQVETISNICINWTMNSYWIGTSFLLQGNLLADDKFECPGCGWNSDVVDAIWNISLWWDALILFDCVTDGVVKTTATWEIVVLLGEFSRWFWIYIHTIYPVRMTRKL